jgi:MYXO-CTERM domain-containing protein
MKCGTLIAGVLVASASSAFASVIPSNGVYNLDGSAVSGAYVGRTPVGVTYSVYTGVASAAGSLFLLEGAAPGSDLRTFGGAPSAINSYVASAGAITRTVSDSAVANGGGGFDLTVTVLGSGNLFPSGFTSGSTPLSSAGFGLGINLGALGSSPLLFPENFVTAATVTLIRASGALAGPFNLPPASFFGAPAGWNGVVGVSLGNGAAVTTDPFTQVVWNISTSNVPAPAGTALLGLGLFAAGRRRR